MTFARAGGTAYQAPAAIDEPTDSQLTYGLRTYQRFDLTVQDDADVEFAADYWLNEQQNRTQRHRPPDAIVDPAMPDDRLVELLDIELRDRQAIGWTDGAATLAGTAPRPGRRAPDRRDALDDQRQPVGLC